MIYVGIDVAAEKHASSVSLVGSEEPPSLTAPPGEAKGC